MIKSLESNKQQQQHLNRTWAALPLKHLREYLFDDQSLGGGGLDCPLKLKLVLTEAPTILEKGKGEQRALHKAGGNWCYPKERASSLPPTFVSGKIFFFFKLKGFR